MLVGFLVEGWDYLILRAYLGKILGCPEDELEADRIEALGPGWQFVLRMIPKALRRFYGKCAQFAVVAIDNDGNLELLNGKLLEDPNHPRHWVHVPVKATCERCRWCQLHSQIEATRPALYWLPKKHGAEWPIIIAVPVEAIEAWLLISQFLLNPKRGSAHAERECRRQFKQRLYGKPEVSRADIETVSLPLIRTLGTEQVEKLKQLSKSFNQFSEQLNQYRDKILGDPDCW